MTILGEGNPQRKARAIAACAAILWGKEAAAVQNADFHSVAQRCAPSVSSETMAALVGVESSFNPYAIGVVGGRLERQPRTKAEAVATAKALDAAGEKFSAGIGQVFRGNWSAYGLTHDTVFEPCPNLRASSGILQSCFERAKKQTGDDQQALRMAFSCYYSNNFSTGFKPDFKGQPSYVDKVLLSAAEQAESPVVPAIRFIPNSAGKEVATSTKPERSIKPSGPESVNFQTPTAPQLPPAPPVAVAAQPAQQAQPEAPLKVTAAPAAAEAPIEATPYVYPSEQATEAQKALVY